MGRSFSELDPEVAVRAQAVVDDAKAADVWIVPTSTGRTALEQLAQFAIARFKDAVGDDPGTGRRLLDAMRLAATLPKVAESDARRTRGVTKADGFILPSVHQSKRAWDFVVLDTKGKAVWDVTKDLDGYRKVGAILEAHGFTWGGRFEPIDATTGLGWDPFHAEMPAQ
jgi:hypothetical protein